MDCQYLGIDNVMALRGDKMKHEDSFSPEHNGHRYASDLVGQIRELNQGHFLDPNMKMEFAPNFVSEWLVIRETLRSPFHAKGFVGFKGKSGCRCGLCSYSNVF